MSKTTAVVSVTSYKYTSDTFVGTVYLKVGEKCNIQSETIYSNSKFSARVQWVLPYSLKSTVHETHLTH